VMCILLALLDLRRLLRSQLVERAFGTILSLLLVPVLVFLFANRCHPVGEFFIGHIFPTPLMMGIENSVSSLEVIRHYVSIPDRVSEHVGVGKCLWIVDIDGMPLILPVCLDAILKVGMIEAAGLWVIKVCHVSNPPHGLSASCG
jgi:hypothetical protein